MLPKITQIPKFCLAADRGKRVATAFTQPRRIAAELDQPLGQSVGYKIRFDDRNPKTACIKLMTDGVLLAETQNRPGVRVLILLARLSANEHRKKRNP